MKFSFRYVECDSQTVFDNLVQLETKNLVKHLDHDNQQWTRAIVTAEEENTHSSSKVFSDFLSIDFFQR